MKSKAGKFNVMESKWNHLYNLDLEISSKLILLKVLLSAIVTGYINVEKILAKTMKDNITNIKINMSLQQNYH